MSELASITINGTRLSDAEAQIIRMSVEAFTVVVAQGIEEGDEGVTAALTEEYLTALASVQKLLDMLPEQGRTASAAPGKAQPPRVQ